MSHRYRLYPDAAQESVLRVHVGQARFVWNLALEQCEHARRVGQYADQKAWDRQLAEARQTVDWLAAGSSSVQQQALRDLRQAFRNWWSNPAHFRHPRRRKHGVSEGFCVRDVVVRKLSRKWAEVQVPKAGRVKFRVTRPVPADAKSARVTLDRAGRWHVSFTSVPPTVNGPGTGEVVGVDRGVAVTLVLSTGEMLHAPKPDRAKRARLQRKMARQTYGTNRRARTKARLARLTVREADRRKDFVKKATTDLARRYDIVRIEDLKVRQMMRSAKGTVDAPGRNVAQKRGLNRSIGEQNWSMFERRLRDKIGDRLQVVPAAYTSQRCHECGHTANADVNAARNIAAGQAVSARGEPPLGSSLKREPSRSGRRNHAA